MNVKEMQPSAVEMENGLAAYPGVKVSYILNVKVIAGYDK